MSKKKILTIALIVAVVAILAAGATLAYFTDTSKTMQNVFTVGNVDIRLAEHKVTESVDENNCRTWTQGDSYLPETQGVTYNSIYPGAVLPKDPTVFNDGTNSAWIRIDVTVSNYDTFKGPLGARFDLSKLCDVSSDWTQVKLNTSTNNDTITYSYYYNNILQANQKTAPLFTKVTIPAALTGADLNGIEQITIDVSAYAVQAEGFTTAAAAFAAVTF